MKRNNKLTGFTLIEMMVAVGVLLILFMLSNNVSLRPQQATSIGSAVDILAADLSSQQTSSMAGNESGGTINTSYGIYFQTDRYVLFRGAVYVPSETDNFTVQLAKTLTFSSINLPNNQAVFATGSGVFVNYDQTKNTVVLYDSSNNLSKTLRINSYGVVENLQ